MFSFKGHTTPYTTHFPLSALGIYSSVLRYQEPTRLHASYARPDLIMVCSSQGTNRDRAVRYADYVLGRYLITFDRVGPVGRFDVGRRFFGVSQQPRGRTITDRRYFGASPGHIHPRQRKNGVKWFQKWGKVVRATGYTLA